MKYRRKINEVEAFQSLDNQDDYPRWLIEAVIDGKIYQRDGKNYIFMDDIEREIVDRSYIVRTRFGELFVVSERFFEQEYEVINE